MDPTEFIPRPMSRKIGGKGQARQLTPDELDRLMGHCSGETERVLWAVMLLTASRVSEALALKWGDIDLDRRLILFRAETAKTKVGRTVEISPKLAQILQGLGPKAPDTLVFRSGNARVSRFTAHRWLAATASAAGLDGVSTHSFRRTTVRALLAAGWTPRDVASLTGHRNLQTLDIYN